MNDKNLWTTFEKTGRVVDYLEYRNAFSDEYDDYFTSDKEQTVGEEVFESENHSNGNDTVRGTYR